jgi:hypothetical protein
MTNFKETLPQIKVVRKTRAKTAVSHELLDNVDEKQVLCTIKKILEKNIENASKNIEVFRGHLEELNKELDYYKGLVEVSRKDAVFMKNKIEYLTSENIKMKKNEH